MVERAGSVLTTTAPDGTKLTTNIYAGGAVIAKQSQHTSGGTTYYGVDWMTSDPVTGTEATYGFTSAGSTTTIGEFEPWGSRYICVIPKMFVPPASVSYFGSGDDPQWQCQPQNAFQLYGDFQAWPIGCQKAFWFEMWPSSVELPAKKKKQNPEKVTEMFHEILHSGLTVSKAQAITTAALGSSKKKDDGEGKEDDGCRSNSDGRINCSVTIHDPGPDTSPIDDISAEHGWQKRTSPEQTSDDLYTNEEAARRILRALLDDPENNCTKAFKWARKLEPAKKLVDSVQFLSVVSNGNEPASKYFPEDANGGETIASFFKRVFDNNSQSARTRGNTAILSFNGAIDFLSRSGSTDSRSGWLYHEYGHFALNLSDIGLASTLLGGQDFANEKDASIALSKFFNNGCPIEDGKPPPPPTKANRS